MNARALADDGLKALAWFALGLVLMLVVPDVRAVWWPGTQAAPFRMDAALLAVGCAGEVLRRARPLTGLLVAAGVLVGGVLLVGESPAGVLLVFADLIYCAVLNGDRRVSAGVSWGAAGSAAALALFSLVTDGAQAAVQTLLSVSAVAIPVAWGREVRHHRTRAETERERAEQAARMGELDRAAAVAAERARMARDLHDVIAGQLSGIAIQSEAALTVSDADPAVLRRVLTDVRRDSVASLNEMRTMIGLLRADGAPEPRTAPAGLDRLRTLVDSGRSAGLVIDVDDRRPAGSRVTAAVDLAAYRIVQESLTNAAKHAPGSTVRLVLHRDGDALVVELENDLVPGVAPAGGTGTGLLGLRERAAAVGGGIDAGPRGLAWTVRARLPAAAGS